MSAAGTSGVPQGGQVGAQQNNPAPDSASDSDDSNLELSTQQRSSTVSEGALMAVLDWSGGNQLRHDVSKRTYAPFSSTPQKYSV